MARTIDKKVEVTQKVPRVDFAKSDSVRLEVPRGASSDGFDRITKIVPKLKPPAKSNSKRD